MQEKVRVVLYTKPGCGLCDQMKAEMKNAGVENLYTLEEVNIETDDELFALYRYDIPVLFIDGAEAFRHRLKAADFAAYVNSLLRAG
jgi:glutaredoxin